MGTRVALRRFWVTLCGVCQLWAVGPSLGAEWSAEPSVVVRGEYNDNLSLTPAPHPSVWGTILSPDIKFSGATETLTVTGGLNLSFDRYYGEAGLNTNNYDFSLRSSYKGERDTLGLDVDAIRDPTLVSELATTGVVLAYRQRNGVTAKSSWNRSLTEATALIANYSFTNVHYDDTAGTSLIDYQDQSASFGVQSNLDERSLVSVSAYYDRYETNPSSFTADTYGIQGGYERAFSETLRGNITVGWRRTQSTIQSNALVCNGPIIVGVCFGTITEVTSAQKNTTSGYTLNAFLEKRSETDALSSQVSREIYPTGVGSLVQTDRVQVGWTKQWSETFSSSLSAAAYKSQYIGGVVTGSDSRYYTIEPRLSWRLSEWWVIDAGYHYAHQKSQSNPLSASANVVYLSVRYAWPKLSVSR